MYRTNKIVGGHFMATSTILVYVAVAAGIAAIYKVITSGRGRVSLPGIELTWGK